MEDFFISALVISPAIRFLTNPKRRWNKTIKGTGRILSICLLACLILYKSFKKEPNYFELLNVTPHSSIESIKKSFKSLAFSAHPDRNGTEEANKVYMDLVEKYKFIIHEENRNRYIRFADLVSNIDYELKDITILELLCITLIKNFISIIMSSMIIFLNNDDVFNHPGFLYELFMFFMDIYLRLSKDGVDFMCFVPILRCYTIFELLSFFRDFKTLFIYHSSLFTSPNKKHIEASIGVSIANNNILVIKRLDEVIKALNQHITSHKYITNSNIIWRKVKNDDYVNYDGLWKDNINKTAEDCNYKNTEVLDWLYNLNFNSDIYWLNRNKPKFKDLYKQLDCIFTSKSPISPTLLILLAFTIFSYI